MDERIAQAVEAYLSDRYQDCISQLSEVGDLPFVYEQLTLLSAVRIGHTHLASELLDRALERYPADSLEANLTMLCAGVLRETQLPELQSMARNDVEKSRVHYYIAESLRTSEDNSVAMRGAFVAAALTEADSVERRLAERQCARFGDDLRLAEDRVANLFKRGRELIDRGKGFESIAIWEQAVSLAEAHPQIDRTALAVLHCNLGLRLEEGCEYERALAHLEPAVGIFLERCGPDRLELPLLASAVGRCHLKLAHYPQALEAFQAAVGYWGTRSGENSPDTLTAIDEIAFTYEIMGEAPGSRESAGVPRLAAGAGTRTQPRRNPHFAECVSRSPGANGGGEGRKSHLGL